MNEIEVIKDKENKRKAKIENMKNSFAELVTYQPIPVSKIMGNVPEETKLIILIDIVGFSKFTSRQQLYAVYLLQHYILKKLVKNSLNFANKIIVTDFIPTGDGCYIIANNCKPEVALHFLVSLTGGFQYVKIEDCQNNGLRAAATFGKCIPFLDLARKKNFVGEGMNEASRILSGGQKYLEEIFIKDHPQAGEEEIKAFSKNSLFLAKNLSSSEMLNDYAECYEKLYELDDVTDKHGKKRDVWCLQHIS
ncbi:MAG: hypothetical protein K5866_02905 [Treponema sp.]|nr:hypothetical protein [Treponema sp.]